MFCSFQSETQIVEFFFYGEKRHKQKIKSSCLFFNYFFKRLNMTLMKHNLRWHAEVKRIHGAAGFCELMWCVWWSAVWFMEAKRCRSIVLLCLGSPFWLLASLLVSSPECSFTHTYSCLTGQLSSELITSLSLCVCLLAQCLMNHWVDFNETLN